MSPMVGDCAVGRVRFTFNCGTRRRPPDSGADRKRKLSEPPNGIGCILARFSSLTIVLRLTALALVSFISRNFNEPDNHFTCALVTVDKRCIDASALDLVGGKKIHLTISAGDGPEYLCLR